jgi:eukaryotic translation initiation factor 2C
VTLHSAAELNFVIEGKDGNPDRRVSVAQFYKEYYGCEVRKPRLPCIQVSLQLTIQELT